MRKESLPRNQGFSLIEMMFVIVIIAIITVTTVNIMRSRLSSALVRKAASQMELILQAESAYYSDHQNTVPTQFSDLQAYLTLASNTNPWGAAYTLTPPANTPANTLTVTTTVPNANVALQLVGLLPNASCAGTPPNCNVASPQVTASIPLSQTNKFLFNSSYRAIFWPTSGGSSRVNYVFPANACPTGYILYVNAYLDINPNAEYPLSSGPASNSTISAPGYNTYYVSPLVYNRHSLGDNGKLEYLPVTGFKTQGGGPICIFGSGPDMPTCDTLGNTFNIDLFYTINNSFFSNEYQQHNSEYVYLPGTNGSSDSKMNMIKQAGSTPHGLASYDIYPLGAHIADGGQDVLMGTLNSDSSVSLTYVQSTCSYSDPATHNCSLESQGRRDPQAGFIGYLTVQEWCQLPSNGNISN
jgi:prepilin-type N-terminal cleavage/methylation domain-containing protein